MPLLRRRELRCSLVGEASDPGWPPVFACRRGSSDAEVTPNGPRTRESPRCRTAGAHAFAARRVEGAAQPCFSRLCWHDAPSRDFSRTERDFSIWRQHGAGRTALLGRLRKRRDRAAKCHARPRIRGLARADSGLMHGRPCRRLLMLKFAACRGVSRCVAVHRSASRSCRVGVGAASTGSWRLR